MTLTQKWIAGLALVAIGLTTTCAPYRYEGDNLLQQIAHRRNGDPDDGSRAGVVYAPLWSPPPTRYEPSEWPGSWMEKVDMTAVQNLELDTGRLALWWLGLALAAAAALILAAPRRARPTAPGTIA